MTGQGRPRPQKTSTWTDRPPPRGWVRTPKMNDHEAGMEVDPPVETVMPPGSTDAPGTGTVTTIPSTPITNWAEEKGDEVTEVKEKRANKVAKEEARRASKAERIAKANMARLAGGFPPAPCASCGNPDHWTQDCDRPEKPKAGRRRRAAPAEGNHAAPDRLGQASAAAPEAPRGFVPPRAGLRARAEDRWAAEGRLGGRALRRCRRVCEKACRLPTARACSRLSRGFPAAGGPGPGRVTDRAAGARAGPPTTGRGGGVPEGAGGPPAGRGGAPRRVTRRTGAGGGPGGVPRTLVRRGVSAPGAVPRALPRSRAVLGHGAEGVFEQGRTAVE